MKVISRTQLDEYVASHQLLTGTPDHPEILLTEDDRILKAFYPREKRRLITRRLVWPPAKQFVANARSLERLGIVAPQVEELLFCREKSVHVVRYRMIHGHDVRELCERGDESGLELLTSYLATLHRKGVFFKGIHLANVLKTDERSLALLDISDLQTFRRALSLVKRARNIRHLFNADKEHFTKFGLSRFLQKYFEAARLGRWQQEVLTMRMQWQLDDTLQHRLAG